MPAALNRPPARLVTVSIAVLAVLAYLGVRVLTHPASYDLTVYRAEGLAVRDGLDLYGPLPAVPSLATYPPFAGMMFVPLSVLGLSLLHAVGLAVNLVLVYVVGYLSLRLVGGPSGSRAVVVAGSAALFAEPALTSLRFGQINLALLALVLWDFTHVRHRCAGVGIGLAAGFKVTSVIFIPYLWFTGRYRAACTATVTFAGTVLLSAVALPGACWRYWTQLLFDVGRVGRVENAANQTLRGMFVRMDHTRSISAGETLIIGVALAVGLCCAVLAHRRLDDAWGVPACAVSGLLAAPIAWTHHWVWCVPIAVLLWQRARRWVPAVAVFWSYAVWVVPHADRVELHFSILQIAASNWYVLFGLSFLAGTARMAARSASRSAIAVGCRAMPRSAAEGPVPCTTGDPYSSGG